MILTIFSHSIQKYKSGVVSFQNTKFFQQTFKIFKTGVGGGGGGQAGPRGRRSIWATCWKKEQWWFDFWQDAPFIFSPERPNRRPE
jgi:hypothetical protein